MSVPNEFISKPAGLTNDEYKQIQKHAQGTGDILKRVNSSCGDKIEHEIIEYPEPEKITVYRELFIELKQNKFFETLIKGLYQELK